MSRLSESECRMPNANAVRTVGKISPSISISVSISISITRNRTRVILKYCTIIPSDTSAAFLDFSILVIRNSIDSISEERFPDCLGSSDKKRHTECLCRANDCLHIRTLELLDSTRVSVSVSDECRDCQMITSVQVLSTAYIRVHTRILLVLPTTVQCTRLRGKQLTCSFS